MKLSFPVRAFNAHTYFFAISEKRLHENMQKNIKNHAEFIQELRTNQSQAVRKQFFFLCCGIQSLVLHSDNDHMQKSTSCDLQLSTWR